MGATERAASKHVVDNKGIEQGKFISWHVRLDDDVSRRGIDDFRMYLRRGVSGAETEVEDIGLERKS